MQKNFNLKSVKVEMINVKMQKLKNLEIQKFRKVEKQKYSYV